MYKIIGANQVEYGPVTAEQLREWITEGRVNGQTPAQAEGDATWKPLSMFPEFAAILPPTPPPAPLSAIAPDSGGRERALQLVKPPAIALIVTASLGIVYALFGILMNLLGISAQRMHTFDIPGQNPEAMRLIQMSQGTLGVVIQIFCLLACLFILISAIKMLKLESYGLAVAASIIAIIPCLTPCPCCILGIPFGIWALVVLNKPEVKVSFS